MSLIPCRDHAARIKALEDQVTALVRAMDTATGLTTNIVERLKEIERVPAVDSSLPGYHR